MITALGIIFAFLILLWFTVFVLAATVPTYGETLFTDGRLSLKIIGLSLWIALISGWFMFFNGLSWG